MRRFIKLRAVWSLLMGLSVALLFVANGASAVQPQTINYQGRLYDLTNSPLSGQYDFRFRLYDDALKTTLLWGPEEFTNQSVNNGYFSAPLGSIESFSAAGLDFTDQYYLTVQIKETAAGVWDDETDPPVAFNSYAYSFNTQKLDNPDGLVDIGLGIAAGYQLSGAEAAFAINTAPGFTGTLLSLANDGAEVLNVAGDGTLHWMDGGYKDAYFNVENIVNPYASDPSLAAIFLDSSDDRSTIFGNIVYVPGNIGIGTMTPTTRFDLRGPMNLGGQPTAALSPMGDGRLYYDNDTQDLMLSKNGGAYEPIMTIGDQVWQQNLLVLSPTDPLAEKIEMSNSVNNLIGLKVTNTNDVDNYAGSVIELKGSGADYTNNVYFGKYGDGFWVPSWAGNGVLATDKNLVISAVGATSAINFQVGGGYTTPSTVASLTNQGLVLLPYGTLTGNTGTLALRELSANGSNRIALRSPDALAGDVNLTLPAAYGAAGQFLQTDASGNLNWADSPSVNIYNSDGLLVDTRQVTITDGVQLRFVDEWNANNYLYFKTDYSSGGDLLIGGHNNSEGDRNHYIEFMDNLNFYSDGGMDFSTPTNQINFSTQLGSLQIGGAGGNWFMDLNAVGAQEGLKYMADYSADFVDRSLVDKAYVDSHVGALTFQDVTDNTIASDGYVYYLTGAVEHEDDGGAAKIEVKTGGYEFELRSGDYGSAINLRTESAPGLDDGWMLIRDNRPTTRGLEYELDYSADYTNRSLVDKEYVDGLLGAGGGVTTLNLTATTFDGNFSYGGDTGYAAGNAVCEAEYPGSHYCATNEVITVIYTGDISSWAGTAWIAEGPPGYTANSNDCNGWTSNAPTNLGAFWEFNNTSGGMGWLTNCASVKPVACCQ